MIDDEWRRKQMDVPLKSINYRGVLRFSIPGSWKEEYSETGGGTFFEDRADSGRLRLTILTLQAAANPSGGSSTEILEKLERARGRIETLPNGNALACYDKSASDGGQPYTIFYWLLANAASPKRACIATFSYSVLEGREHDPRVVQDVQLLGQQVRNAEFSAEAQAS
jgi:hypothetical protein